MELPNKEALSQAFKQVQVHLDKIEELSIVPDMSEDAIDTLVKELSENKALIEGKDDWKPFSKGQQFYVEQLVKESGMEPRALLEYHYKRSFADVATEDEMMEVLMLRMTKPTTEPEPATTEAA